VRMRLVIAALAATVLGGCSASGSGTSVSVSGKSLTIYAAAPAGTTGTGADLLDAERLAFNQKSAEVTAFRLHLQTLSSAKPSDNARTAISDTSAIAYLGELQPGTSTATVGITNAEDLLQVSPADTAQGLTDPHTPGLSDVPDKYLESQKTYGRTFARVVPNTGAEARALAAELRTLGVHSLYVGSDGSDYAVALAAALRTAATGVSITPGPLDATRTGGASAVFAASDSIPAARKFFTDVATAHPGTTLLGPSALADPALLTGLPAGARLYVSAPGYLPRSAPAAAASFTRQFRSQFGHVPVPQAIFGYEAMSSVLDVLHQAGTSASSRGFVVHAFLTQRNRAASVIGPYSMDANGDTSLAPFVILRLRSGQLVPFAQQQG
jgi:ABC-type branched-subunit amino acid transport system substrate-binding protein